MNRPWKSLTAFVFAALVLLAAMALLTLIGVRLDTNQQRAESRAGLEQRARLALWRMDSAVGPIVAQENARPYFEYAPFYPAERAYTNMFAPLNAGEVLVPSPLLTFSSPNIHIHFQFGPDGTLSSPSVPQSNMRDLAESGYREHEDIERARKQFAKMQQFVDRERLQKALEETPQAGDVAAPKTDIPPAESNEYEQRVKSVKQSITNQALTNKVLLMDTPSADRAPDTPSSVMKPFWSGGELFLARVAPVDGKRYLQGCWLNWPALREELLTSIEDLLPNATLRPSTDSGQPESSRRLAAAPIHLNVEYDAFTPNALSPLRLALGIAWVCVIAVIVSLGALLWGTLTLSERRATFVSAVTHELRTPLTTFQLYTDLLAENRVPDPQKRSEYFETLRNEATRLRHLVENVLAFARLERGPAQPPLEMIGVADLINRVRPGIETQCTRANMTIEWNTDNVSDVALHTNAEIVEQILTNLVDNACKYAANGDQNQISIDCRKEANQLIVSVLDRGPGLQSDAARKLFRPFAKSATEAAASAPGVGLGLALSRRLARSLHGDLRWKRDHTPGCRFELSLPIN